MKNGANFGFLAPNSFRGNFEEIDTAKVLLETKPQWESFVDFGFSDIWESAVREIKISKNYP